MPRNNSHESTSFRAGSQIGLHQDSTKKQSISRTASKQALKELPNPDLLTIHVYDENRQMTRDFKCHRKLLLDNMKYFESYLKDTENNEEIDI